MLQEIPGTTARRMESIAKGGVEVKTDTSIFIRALFSFLAAMILIACAQTTPLPTATSLPTHTAAATSTPTPLPTSTPTITPTPVGGGTGKLIFEYGRGGFEQDFPELEGDSHIFISNWDGSELTPITTGLEPYNTLADVSPDGRKVLVITWPYMYTAAESTSAVYVVDLDHLDREPVKLASGIMYTPNKTAVWLDNSRVVLVDKEQGSWGVYLMNSDGTGRTKLSRYIAGVNPYDLRVSTDARWVFWHAFGFQNGQYIEGGLWRASVDGSELSALGGSKEVLLNAISPDGSQAVWITERSTYPFERINLAPVTDLYQPADFHMDDNYFHKDAEILWSPDGTKVLLHRPACIIMEGIEPSSSVTGILWLQKSKITKLPLPTTYADRTVHFLAWAPDGQSLLMKVSPLGSCYMSWGGGKLELLNQTDMTSKEILTNGVLQEAVGNIQWLP